MLFSMYAPSFKVISLLVVDLDMVFKFDEFRRGYLMDQIFHFRQPMKANKILRVYAGGLLY
jgi:hypothetical protein